MVDDDMEISSEHGRNAGDEDIDIDIDFTTGQTDEDYILEDVEPHGDFEDGLQHNTLLDANTDDLMIDEDDNSYIMDDADVDPDGGQMESETVEMPYAAEDAAINPFPDMDPEALLEHPADNSVQGPEILWEQTQQAEGLLAVVEAETGTGDLNREFDQNEDNVQGASPKEITNNAEDTTETHQSQESINVNLSNEADNGRPPNLTEAVVEVHSPTNNEEDGSHPQSIQGEVFTEEGDNGENNNQVEVGKEVSPVPNIRVVYQATEYALFSTLDNDDPDSYFLSDVLIMQKPLSTFFSSIREIIQEDLSDEDELCLAVEILGLETDERSASLLEDVTLGQIVDLYQKLLQNDGVGADHPLSIMLGIRPNFVTRLGNLAAKAAEGHGLSEVITWHDESESAEDTTEFAQNGSVKELEGESYQQEGGNGASHGEVDVRNATDATDASEKDKGSNGTQGPTKTTIGHETEDENHALDTSIAKVGVTEERPRHSDAETLVAVSDENEEDELLEYENEDAHQVNKKDGSFLHETEVGRDTAQSEHASANEESRRKSVSPNAEDVSEQAQHHKDNNVQSNELVAGLEQEDGDEQHIKKSPESESKDNQYGENESVAPEDDQNHYLEEVGEDFGADELDYEHESAALDAHIHTSNELVQQISAATDTDSHSAFEDDGDLNIEHDEVGGQEERAYDETGEEENEYDEASEEDEIKYEDSAIQNQQEEVAAQENGSPVASPVGNNLSANNFTFTDPAESESATMSANTLEADEIDIGEEQGDTENGNSYDANDTNEPVLTEQQDEINYDDDDEDEDEDGMDLTERQKTPILETAPEPKASSGKRPRADADLEDIVDNDGQESKRPRS
ncbi:hypothetical protein B7463_g5335, partial [Scytalidium lignicola]